MLSPESSLLPLECEPPAPSRPADAARAARGQDGSEYQVVARRYRPQTFDELVGQEHVARALIERHRHRPRGARLSVHRGQRRRQDLGGPHSGQGARLRAWPHPHALQPLRYLREHCRGERRRCAGNRRSQQSRHRRDPPAAAKRRHPAQPGPLQDLHHRRSPHAHPRGLQRVAEDVGRAAGACEVHLLHDRSQQDPHHHPLALPAVRFCRHSGPVDPRTAAADCRGRRGRSRAGGPRVARPPGQRLDARQPVAAGAIAGFRRPHDSGRRRARSAGHCRRRAAGAIAPRTWSPATRRRRSETWTPR